ncbi:MAG: hypothetical protein HY089_13225 [Ignavibacteriales bacterium]|nr:hypothetical protein [Ignavibacteriales bacterium]
MISSKVLVAGLAIGIVSAFLDWVIMGILFQKYQAFTPDTWRKGEKKDNVTGILVSLYFGVAIAWFYSNAITLFPLSTPGHIDIATSIGIGIVCWTVFTLPVIVSTGITTNWHSMTWLGICINAFLKVLTAASIVVILM